MILGVIPARYQSSRLPGKPLADIGGIPMILHTYRSALKSKLLDKICVAVDDERVKAVIEENGGWAEMTPVEVPTGSDRIALIAKKYPEAKIIVNIQGDEPFISGKMIDEAIEPLLFDQTVQVSTLAKKIKESSELLSPAAVKVVFDYNNFAMYFSRSPIPYVRDAGTPEEMLKCADIYKHIGLYVYRNEALVKFTILEPTDLEKAEKLEQLRMLEHGFKIKVVITDTESLSVDTPEDLEKARVRYLSQTRKQSGASKK